MKKAFIILFAIIVTISFSSCETEVDLKLKNTFPKLVVEGNVLLGLDTLIETQEIKLSLSANYTGNNFPEPVTNATVKVVDGVSTFDFTHIDKGIYRSNFTGKTNATYKLIIVHNGNTYEAIETMVDGPKIDSLTLVYQSGAFGDDGGNFVAVNTKDPANKRNYYLWRLLINNEYLINPTPGNRYRSIQKDDYFNGQSLVNYVPSDEFPVKPGDTTQMQQFNISEQMYNFYFSIFNLTASSSITGDVPPGKILGNVINITNPRINSLGYFGACSVSIKTKVQ
jgi:hypothetical protein